MRLEANNEQLEEMANAVAEEKKKNEELLKEVLPASVADQILRGAFVDARGSSCVLPKLGRSWAFPGEYTAATIMFTDCPTFQKITPLCKPQELVNLLNELFTRFDRLVTLHDVRLCPISGIVNIKTWFRSTRWKPWATRT